MNRREAMLALVALAAVSSAAKALGLTIPPSVLNCADRLIE